MAFSATAFHFVLSCTVQYVFFSFYAYVYVCSTLHSLYLTSQINLSYLQQLETTTAHYHESNLNIPCTSPLWSWCRVGVRNMPISIHTSPPVWSVTSPAPAGDVQIVSLRYEKS